MCGRFAIETDAAVLLAAFDALAEEGFTLAPRWNVAPTQSVPLVRVVDGVRRLGLARWGLVPSWARDATGGPRAINARAETVATKSTFRAAFQRRRCVVPASGWFEWRRSETPRQPFYFSAASGGPLAFAALWERWRDPAGGEVVDTCAIVTCAPNALAARVHDRMPVVLGQRAAATWLDVKTDLDVAQSVLRACPSGWLRAWPVSRRVGDVRADDRALLEPVSGAV